jgi:glycosyltransferase involved in cell wall biosynthesis
MLISVVVPIYNSERYLKRCVDSLLGQTYRDLEVILVDDGSNDGSGAICDRCAEEDDRVRALHKPNGGEASARQAGLDMAGGDYIMFCDSDDVYLPDAVESLAAEMEVQGVDLAVGGYLEKTGGAVRFAAVKQRRYQTPEIAYHMLTDADPYGLMYLMSTVNGSLFKAPIIRAHGIAFDQHFVVGNDTLFVCAYLARCGGEVAGIFKPVYVYYKFHVSERVQGMAWVYPDAYKLSVRVWESLLCLTDLDAEARKPVVASLFDALIRQWMRAAMYEEHLQYRLTEELRRALDAPLVQEAAAAYKRTRIRDSRLIPWACKHDLPGLAAWALRRRAGKLAAAREKSEYVRRIVGDE